MVALRFSLFYAPNQALQPTGWAVESGVYSCAIGAQPAAELVVRPHDTFMKEMRDGNSAGFGSQFLFIILGLVGLVINAFAILFVSFWCWVRRKPGLLTPEGREMLHHLQSLPPDKREAFLARFSEAQRESWRTFIESHEA